VNALLRKLRAEAKVVIADDRRNADAPAHAEMCAGGMPT
jgi:hypothetical protein